MTRSRKAESVENMEDKTRGDSDTKAVSYPEDDGEGPPAALALPNTCTTSGWWVNQLLCGISEFGHRNRERLEERERAKATSIP